MSSVQFLHTKSVWHCVFVCRSNWSISAKVRGIYVSHIICTYKYWPLLPSWYFWQKWLTQKPNFPSSLPPPPPPPHPLAWLNLIVKIKFCRLVNKLGWPMHVIFSILFLKLLTFQCPQYVVCVCVCVCVVLGYGLLIVHNSTIYGRLNQLIIL